MTPTTQTLREQAFRPLECDIPQEMTIEHYRSSRTQREVERRREVERTRGGRRMPRLRRS